MIIRFLADPKGESSVTSGFWLSSHENWKQNTAYIMQIAGNHAYWLNLPVLTGDGIFLVGKSWLPWEQFLYFSGGWTQAFCLVLDIRMLTGEGTTEKTNSSLEGIVFHWSHHFLTVPPPLLSSCGD